MMAANAARRRIFNPDDLNLPRVDVMPGMGSAPPLGASTGSGVSGSVGFVSPSGTGSVPSSAPMFPASALAAPMRPPFAPGLPSAGMAPSYEDAVQPDTGFADINPSLGQIDAVTPEAAGMLGRPARQKFDWKRAAATFAASMAASYGNPAGMHVLQQMSQRDRFKAEEEREERERQRQLLEPQTIGRHIVQRGPDGGYAPIYSAPSPAEEYAGALGHAPGTPGYIAAVEDYALKGWGGTAFERKSELEGVRFGYRDDLQGQRLQQSDTNNLRTTGVSRENNIRSTGISRDNNIRSTGTSRDNSIRSTGTSRDNSIRSNDTSRVNAGLRADVTRGGAAYQGRGGRGGGASARIVNPQTGQAMVLKNGQWVPER